MIIPSDLKLETDKVILRPLQPLDLASFHLLAADPSIWTYFTFLLDNPEEMQRWVENAIKEREEGKRIPFTIIEKETGLVCGSTSLGSISVYDKRIEIGWSWLGKNYQGTGINFHAKFSLLSYAFEYLQFERVEIKTDNLNERSKHALMKIGAKEEGVLRSHMQMPLNRRRDSVFFKCRHDCLGFRTPLCTLQCNNFILGDQFFQTADCDCRLILRILHNKCHRPP